MEKVLVLCLVLHTSAGTDCTPGKITGISCPSSRDIIREFQPSIDTLKAKFTTVYKTTGDSIVATRLLIRDNILNTKNQIGRKFSETRNLLLQAKTEATLALPGVKACIINQNLEFAKIRTNNFFNCNGNFSSLLELRKQILELDVLCANMPRFCARLNPLDGDMVQLRMCLDKKIKDLQLELGILEQKVANEVKEVVNLSTDCVVKESGEVHSRIGAIEGGVKNCKDVR